MPFLTLVFVYYFALPVFLLRKFATELFKPPVPEHYITLALGYSLVGSLLHVCRILWTGEMAIRTNTTSIQLAVA